ncbi:hypothetical protein [Pseudactinotalea sp.]|uniref:hypothetical protein n=1 Tax=Pseudactinotalea sp. TaxID=1926260 RepID=UPI003B3ADCDD
MRKINVQTIKSHAGEIGRALVGGLIGGAIGLAALAIYTTTASAEERPAGPGDGWVLVDDEPTFAEDHGGTPGATCYMQETHDTARYWCTDGTTATS